MDLWVKLDKFLRKKKIVFVFKGYTCRFKSEASASIALRPWTLATLGTQDTGGKQTKQKT